jgi:integrase/recombinase XerD
VSLEPGYYKDALSEEERAHFLSSISEVKWQAVCALMSYCGLRTVEVTRLRLQDLDLEKNIMMVKGKGKHGHVAVKLFAACVPYLQSWLQERKTVNPGHEKLFVDGKGAGLSCDQIRYQVKKALKSCGLDRKKLSAHSLRHTAAQVLIDKNVEAIYVQRQLRHSSLDTTQKYIFKKLDEKFFEKLPDTF